MAGSFSFLPLSNKPGLKASVQAKQQPDDEPQKTRTLPEHRASSAEVEMNDKDDEWSDTDFSSEGPSPLKKTKSSANFDNSIVTVKKVSTEKEAALLPYMPPLFGTDLPPCGAQVQVAYEIVNSKLRQRWLNSRGHASTTDICKAVKEELSQQNSLWPPFSVKGHFKRRKPWCREPVFKYQLYWIEYFAREAQALEPMTESEIMDRKKQSSVPQELRFNVERSDISKLWDEWHVKKRAKTPVLPDAELETDAEVQSPKGETQQESNGAIEPVEPAVSSDEIQPPLRGTNSAGDDAYLWSQNDHD